MSGPLDYSMCRDTITLYRRAENEIFRYVYHNVYLQMRDEYTETSQGPEFERDFLLIIPGQVELLTGDKIVPGVGPMITPDSFQGWISSPMTNLCTVQYVQTYHYMGQVCHTEAGRKSSAFRN